VACPVSFLMGPLAEQLRVEAPWLFDELGFKIAASDFMPRHMGDSLTILDSGTLLLQFTRDKGQVFAGMAHPSERQNWWPLWEVHASINGIRPEDTDVLPRIEGRFALNVVLSTLRADYPEILLRFTSRWGEMKPELDRRRETLHRYRLKQFEHLTSHTKI
jgi:hypothetical protein